MDSNHPQLGHVQPCCHYTTPTFGAPAGARTRSLRPRMPPLFRLSYGGAWSRDGESNPGHQRDKLASWPLNDREKSLESLAGVAPTSRGLQPRASSALPQGQVWFPRQDSNPYLVA